MSQSFTQFLSLIKADMQHRCSYENKHLNLTQAVKFIFNIAAFSTVLYRLQTFLYANRLSFIGYFVRTFNGLFCSIDIDPSAKIEGGLFIMHCSYICIGKNVVIGKNCMMAHQNSIIPSPFFKLGSSGQIKGPTLGDNVVLGAGATLTGDIVLGNNVQVSMNAAVENSFSDDAVLFGVPAKNIVKKHTAESIVEEVSER